METLPSESVDLILTSPPFALKRKKEYGNKSEEEYVNWFEDFGLQFRRIMKKRRISSYRLGRGLQAWFPD